MIKPEWRAALKEGGASDNDLELFELRIMRWLEKARGYPITADMAADAMVQAMDAVGVKPVKKP